MTRVDRRLLPVLLLSLSAISCGSGTDSSAPPAPATVAASSSAPSPSADQTSNPEASKEVSKQQKEEVAGLEILSVLSVEQEVDILAQRRGIVQEVLVDQGSVVQKGAPLARLDDRELLIQRDKARADLAIADSNVKYNEAELKARQAALRRAQQMFEAGLNSQADLEEAEFRARGSQHDLDGWRATVDKQKAELRRIELEIEKTILRAPFSGVIVRRFLRSGQDVLADDKCFRLSQLTPLLVRFLVPETSPRRPRTGETVSLELLSSPRQKYSARIEKCSPIVDAASGSYEVTAQLTGANLSELRPGMSVRILWGGPPKR
jgi:RND family efflux transporter MFP subunit